MTINNKLVLYQVTFYVLTLVLSICVFLPIAFHLYDFKGHCLLFTNGTWRASDGQFIAEWSTQAFCDFNLAWGCLTLILAITQIHRFVGYLCSESDATFLTAFADVVVSIFMLLGALAGAIVITMGYQIWCDAIMQRFEQCEDASSNPIFKDEGIDTKMFYTQFGTAQRASLCDMAGGTVQCGYALGIMGAFTLAVAAAAAVCNTTVDEARAGADFFYFDQPLSNFGAWCLWVCWVGLCVVSLLKICKYHQVENIRTSMARERTRSDRDSLINRR